MEDKKEIKEAQKEFDKAMIDVLKGMADDLRAPKENYELKFLRERLVVLETKVDMLLQMLLK